MSNSPVRGNFNSEADQKHATGCSQPSLPPAAWTGRLQWRRGSPCPPWWAPLNGGFVCSQRGGNWRPAHHLPRPPNGSPRAPGRASSATHSAPAMAGAPALALLLLGPLLAGQLLPGTEAQVSTGRRRAGLAPVPGLGDQGSDVRHGAGQPGGRPQPQPPGPASE